MTVMGVDEVLCNNMAAHLQLRDIGVEPPTHLRTVEPAGTAEVARYHAAAGTQGLKNGVLYGVLIGSGEDTTAVVAEVGPPLLRDESRLLVEELAIGTARLADYLAFPSP